MDPKLMSAVQAGKQGGAAEGKAGGGQQMGKQGGMPQRQHAGVPMGGIRPPAQGINRVDSGMQVAPPNPVIGGPVRGPGYGATPPGMGGQGPMAPRMDIPFDPRTLR